MRVVVIEAEQGASGNLASRLAESGFARSQVVPAQEALRNGPVNRASALVLDLGLSGRSGSEVTRHLREGGQQQPLIVVSARGDWRDKVECLDAGADDFLSKPVRSEEVAARLFALIRRTSGNASGRIKQGGLELDLRARCAWLDGTCLNLTRNEFRLLRLLMLQPGRTMKHREIQDKLYAEPGERSANALEVQIARLRRKIGNRRIETVRGIGYRFTVDAPTASQDTVFPEPCKAAGDRACAFPDRFAACKPQEQRNDACLVHSL